MLLNKDHYINLKNGSFDATTKADLDHLFTTFATDTHNDKLIVYFHGGLVDVQEGMNGAESLMDYYKDLGIYEVFFVWETGLLEVISTNLTQIYNEPIFQQLLMRTIQFASAKVTQGAVSGPVRGIGGGERLQLPDEREIWNELQQPANGHEPFATVNLRNLPQDAQLQKAEEEQFREVLNNDYVLQQESQAIANSLHTPGENRPQGPTRGIQVGGSTHTLMSPWVLDAFRGKTPGSVTRGIEPSPLLAAIELSVGVLARVLDRFAQRRDHGLYATVVEELLRQFYIANTGKDIWDDMKKETITAFDNDPNQYGGTAFLEGLKACWESGKHPHITLVGHSAGAIYICQFLQQVDKYLAPGVTFDVILLAPACTFKLFTEMFQEKQQRIGAIRVFGMEDKVEQADVLVPLIYPHSLLYLVSGIFEDDPDSPLLGMQRYYTGEAPYDIQEVMTSVTYLSSSEMKRTVWSVVSGSNGLSSNAQKHGEFPQDDSTLKSIGYILTNGL